MNSGHNSPTPSAAIPNQYKLRNKNIDLIPLIPSSKLKKNRKTSPTLIASKSIKFQNLALLQEEHEEKEKVEEETQPKFLSEFEIYLKKQNENKFLRKSKRKPFPSRSPHQQSQFEEWKNSTNSKFKHLLIQH